MANFFQEYWWALIDGRSDRDAWTRVITTHALLPLVFGAAALLVDSPASDSQAISVISILAGLLFSMLVLLIDLRGRVRRGEESRAAHGDRDSLNLDYAYYATSYAIIVGFTVAGLLLLQERVWAFLPAVLQVGYNWVAYTLTASFAFAVMHCLRRLRRCYEVFGKGNQ